MTVHRVTFRAEAAGPAPLAWGQLAIWDVLRWLPPGDDSLNQLDRIPVPAGTTVDRVLLALRLVVERHQALRSVYFERDGVPQQQVHAEGGFDVHELPAGGTDGEELRRGAFDDGAELPVRAAVLTRAGQPETVVLVLSHMAVDGWSFQVVKRDLRALLAEPDPAALPPRARQPVERAAAERSPAGQAKERATLQHWADRLRVASPTMLEKPAGPPAETGDWARIESPAAGVAAELLAVRTGTNAVTVLMAALAALLAARVDEQEAVLRLIVTTRFSAEDRDYVGAFNQNALLRLALTDEPFEVYLRRAAAATFAAYRRCEADPRKVEQLVADVAAARGFVPDGYCFFNDVRFTTSDRAARAARGDAPVDLDALRAATRIEVLHKQERQKGAKFFAYLQRLDDVCRMVICLDPAFLGPYRAVSLLADLERLLVAGARTPERSLAHLRAEALLGSAGN